MDLPISKGSDKPIMFLKLLLVFIAVYTGIMFYMNDNILGVAASAVVASILVYLMR